ncbi:cell wall protein [Streptomyces sp. CB02923]|uniref:GAF domain-containing protein n=1 Tax=Streptomyces sp. CB02923 TaxID=1718985 RepID=UPI000939912F|nr:GAF domain-containing protein [Streptomyces sp. CB02923]OKI09538.1 cell wall protein [Streptomyces sp. CB02923]
MVWGSRRDVQAQLARRRAARARQRAEHATACAEQQEILAASTGGDLHLHMAQAYRRSAQCHLSSARLQEAYADRMTAWGGEEINRPRFMTGVAEACGTSSAALTLMGTDHGQLSVASSDQPSRAAQDLEFMLGEGPAHDASAGGRLVSAAGRAIESRWPAYGPALASLGIREVITAPLRTEGSCIGALAVFDPGDGLGASDTLVVIADALTRTVLLGPDADPELYEGADHRDRVQQAAGVLSVQAGCRVQDALAMIKARAFTDGQTPDAIAEQVVRGTLKLAQGI